ncbi:hypothetical protein AAC03nite_23280 [Alicyclobacillus acidoterrestris]|uniref:hypothetical protein n=1 Tax=Alicyclobacillus suci TaxID=2816080 RepID=UPI001195105E|nr:hypothetical protein [Alicyclobacillus suci]GEO26543.1 hypothetical protein AAC03nite_23280 [Alicyclobacillus acidoterrestris]
MEDLQQAIAEIKMTAAMRLQQGIANPKMPLPPTKDQQAMEAMLRQLAEALVGADKDVQVTVTGGQSPGLVAGFFDAHFNTPRFIVKTTWTTNGVQVSVTDGKWEQLPNQNGLWADWTDERVVFQGAFSESVIRRTLETGFLNWYQRVKMDGHMGIPVQ